MSSELLTQSVWWGTNALEGLLLFRAARGGFLRKYSVFYLYLGYVLLESLVRFYFYEFRPDLFQQAYWLSQFVSVTIGYGVIWEISCHVLEGYPGARRVVRTSLLTIFVFVVCLVTLKALRGSIYSPAKTSADLESYFRVVQAVLLVVIVGLLTYHRVQIGRNLKGMILGYGFFIGITVMHLAVGAYVGGAFQPLWRYLPAITYSLTLLIWCSSLWSYHPNPVPSVDLGLERDYELFVLRTSRLLTQCRANLLRGIRP